MIGAFDTLGLVRFVPGRRGPVGERDAWGMVALYIIFVGVPYVVPGVSLSSPFPKCTTLWTQARAVTFWLSFFFFVYAVYLPRGVHRKNADIGDTGRWVASLLAASGFVFALLDSISECSEDFPGGFMGIVSSMAISLIFFGAMSDLAGPWSSDMLYERTDDPELDAMVDKIATSLFAKMKNDPMTVVNIVNEITSNYRPPWHDDLSRFGGRNSARFTGELGEEED